MTIDLGAGWITLASAPADDGAAFEPLEARFMRDDPPGRLDLHLGVRGRTRTLWFEADSGNLDAVLVSPDAVAELGLGAEVSAQLARGDVVHARIAILGLEPLDVALRSSPMIYDGLLNAAVLERLVLVVDATAERAFAGSSAEGPRLRPPRPGCRRRGQLARAALSVARSARGSGRGGATPRAMR